MTTVTLSTGKRVLLTIAEKAKLLKVFSISERGHLACTSGSNPKNAYVVHHNGHCSTYCPCKDTTGKCAHRVAVNAYLEANQKHYCSGCSRVRVKYEGQVCNGCLWG